MTDQATEISELKRLNAELAEAEIERDVEKLAILLDDDYLGVDPSGALLTKEKIITTYATGDVQLESIVSSDLRVRVLGRTGIITGRSLIKGKTQAGEFMALFRYTDVYRNFEGDWKLVSSQLTPLVAETPMLL
jgi:hypothetical protein